MKNILFTAFFFTATIVFAQSKIIKGQVVSETGSPISYANVTLLTTNKTTVTDKQGFYEFYNLNNKQYVIQVSFIGYDTQKKTVTLSNKPMRIDFSLQPKNTQLQEVEIIGRKEKGYKNTNSFIATKSATKLMDVPQSVGYVTKEVIADQAAFTLNEVVKNVSGINQFSFYNDFTVRGFRLQGQGNSGMLLNGSRVMTSFWSQQLIPHIERVEVIKGPASALFGNSSPGGTINSVTKKPLLESRKSISTSIGSFNTFRLLSDFTGPLTKDKKLLYRLNIGYQSTDGFRDLQFSKDLVLAPSFSFLPSDKTRVNFDVVYQNSKGRLDRGQAVFGNGNLYSTSIRKSLSAENDYLNQGNLNVTLSLHHKFTKNLSFSSKYLNSGYNENLLEHRNANNFLALGDGTSDITKVAMRVFIRKRSWSNQNFTNFFNYNFNIGQVKNKLLVGYDYFIQDLKPGGSQLQASAYLLKNGKATNSFDVNKKNDYVLDAKGNPVANVAPFDLTSTNGNALRNMNNYVYSVRNFTAYEQINQGVYIQNQLSYKKLDVLVGLRKDNFIDYLNYNTSKEKKITQNALIPRVGVVYKINPNINAYATWVRGYQPQIATTINKPGSGGPFKPLKSKLYEVGFKSEWFQKRLGVTLALYDITQKGTLYSAYDKEKPNKLVQIGQEKSKGLEIDSYGKILENWSLILNYAYNHAYFAKADKKTLNIFGKQKPNAPKQTFNLWTKYMINRGDFNGIGFGLGYNYVSQRIGSIVRDPKLIPLFPSYGVVNTAMYYNADKFKIQLNFNNVFNKIHWVGGYDFLRAFPGKPRNIKVTVSYSF